MAIKRALETTKKYISFIARYKRYVLTLFVVGFFSSAFRIALPYLSKSLIDSSFLKKDAQVFLKISLLSIILFFISLFFKGLENIIRNISQVRIKSNVAGAFLQKILTLDMFFFQRASTGENIYRLEDTERVSIFLSEQVPRFLADALMFVCMLGLSLYISPLLTIPLILLLPLAASGYVFVHKKRKQVFEELWRTQVRLYKTMGEVFSRIFIIKAFRNEPQVRRRYMKELFSSLRMKIKSARLLLWATLTSDLIFKGFLGGISILGGWMIIKGQLTLGQFTAFLLYAGQIVFLAGSLSSFFSQIMKDSFATNKFLEIMQMRAPQKRAGSKTVSRFKERVEFKDISFGYTPDRHILRNLSFGVDSGSWHALVGPSGCGKTTLVSLLLGLYEPQGGGIFIDGHYLPEIAVNSLGENIAIASQEAFLFSGTLRDNITCMSKRFSLSEIEAAASHALIDDFIQGLPQGYDTLIGENAFRLSEGQKQKVAIARALVRHPSILILDEAMASLDSENEFRIIEKIKKADIALVILISHRLSTVMACKHAHYLKGPGSIVSSSPEALLEKDRDFRTLFNQQVTRHAE